MDYKILSSILAGQLNRIIKDYINEDQTGFISGRYMKDDICRLRNVINKVQKDQIPAVLVYLDAEKAFERFEWGYIKAVIKHFEIPSFVAKWLELLYVQQE